MTLPEILGRVMKLIGDIGCDHVDITDGRDQWRFRPLAPPPGVRLGGHYRLEHRLRIGDAWGAWQGVLSAWNTDQVLATTWELVDGRAQVIDHAYLSPGDTPYASGDVAYRGCFHCGRARSAHAR